MGDIVYGWHFLNEKGRAYKNYAPPPVGEWEPPIDNPEPCVRGYHGSPTVLDALEYAAGPILGRCEYRGVVWDNDRNNRAKWAARERRCIARVDASRLLRYAAAHFAETAMRRVGWTDPRSWAAAKAARDYADGKIGFATLSAACSAAFSAASLAAFSAASSAASLAAFSAAFSAASSAAACSAAFSAASLAAFSAAFSADSSAAYSEMSAWLDSAALDLDVEPMWEVPHD